MVDPVQRIVTPLTLKARHPKSSFWATSDVLVKTDTVDQGFNTGLGVEVGTDDMPGRFGVDTGVTGVDAAGTDRYVMWSAS